MSPPSQKVSPKSNIWDSLNIVAALGYNAGNGFKPNEETYKPAAPDYRGASVEVQTTYQLFSDNFFTFRLGGSLGAHLMGLPSSLKTDQDSGFQALSLGVLGEALFNFYNKKVGGGVNLSVGGMAFSASNANIGLPFNASMGLTSEGGLKIGLQVFVDFLDHKYRLAYSFDTLPLGLNLGTGPGQPDTNIGYGTHSVLLGFTPSSWF